MEKKYKYYNVLLTLHSPEDNDIYDWIRKVGKRSVVNILKALLTTLNLKQDIIRTYKIDEDFLSIKIKEEDKNIRIRLPQVYNDIIESLKTPILNKKAYVVKSVIRLNIIYPDCYENYNMKYSFLPSDKMTQSTNIDDNSSNSDIRQPDKLTDTQNQDESNNNVDVDFSEFDLTDNTEDNDGFTPISKLVANYGVTIQTVSIYIKNHSELFEGHLKKPRGEHPLTELVYSY